MSIQRNIRVAIGAILLWSSTAVSGFAATNTINPEKFQSDTVNLPVESTPVRSLNLTPDTHLIARNYGDEIYQLARWMDKDNYIPKWEDALKQPDSKKIILEFCPSQPQDKVENCWKILDVWASAKEMQLLESRDWSSTNFDLMDKLRDISTEVMDIIQQRETKR